MIDQGNVHEDARAAYESLTKGADAAPEPKPELAPAPAPTETPNPEPTPEPSPAGNEPEPQSSGRQRDAKGRYVTGSNATGPVTERPEAVRTPEPQLAAQPPTETPKPKPGEADVSRPPPGLGPLARSKWDATPVEIREDFWRREKETSQALRVASEARQFQETWGKVVSPYEAIFRSEGVDASTGVQNLLQSMAVLHGPNGAAKAAVAASVIRSYGVPLESVLQMLGVTVQDGQLTQTAPSQPSGEWAQAQQLISQLQQRIADMEGQRSKAGEQWAKSTLSDFRRTHEFYDDLKEEILKLYNAGYELEDAYELAAYKNPQTRRLLQEKEAEAKKKEQEAATAKARAASVSVRSAPVANRPTPRGNDIHADAEAAYHELLSRGG